MEFEWNGSVLSYRQSGSGPETLLLFHGFGQDSRVFNDLATQLATRYSCYAFDLFFHGGSTRPENDLNLSPDDWTSMIRAFIQKHNITRFSLLGYSIGARASLALTARFAGQINRIYLIAPGGITTDPWFSFATGTGPGRMLFRYLMESEHSMWGVVKFIRKAGLATPQLLRFASMQLNSREKRTRVYRTWITYRKLRLTPEAMDLMNKHGVEILIIASKGDHVIPAAKLRKWTARAGGRIRYEELDVSHPQLLREVTHNAAKWFTA